MPRALHLPDGALAVGQEIQVTLVPSVVRQNRMEPIRVSVYGEGHEHKATVVRNAAGEFAASSSPMDERVARAEVADDDQPQASSLYASLHYTAGRQGIPPDVIIADPEDPRLRDRFSPAGPRRRRRSSSSSTSRTRTRPRTATWASCS